MAAINSLTVVLPLLPVTATAGITNDARHARAICPNARRESRTSICGSGDEASRDTSAPDAPLACASPMKSLPSNRSPGIATNSAPDGSVRVSVVTAPNALAHLAPAELGVAAVECPLPLPRHGVNLVWHERYSKDPGHTWLRELMIDIARELQRDIR